MWGSVHWNDKWTTVWSKIWMHQNWRFQQNSNNVVHRHKKCKEISSLNSIQASNGWVWGYWVQQGIRMKLAIMDIRHLLVFRSLLEQGLQDVSWPTDWQRTPTTRCCYWRRDPRILSWGQSGSIGRSTCLQHSHTIFVMTSESVERSLINVVNV